MIIPARKKYPHFERRERRCELLCLFSKRALRGGTAQRFDPNQHLPRGLPTWKPARQPPSFKRYAVSDTRSLRIAHTACSYIMSDSDDSDDSGLPFDVEIEKCEKRLQLARYKKKYRNEWDYITNRWQEKHIHIVLKDIEQKWRVYSAGSHEQIHF